MRAGTSIRCASELNRPSGSRCALSTTFKSPGDMSFQCLGISHGSLLKFTSTRAAFAQPGPACQAVPRPQSSFVALRLPAPIGHHSGSPCCGLPRCGLLFCAKRPTTRVPAYVSCVGDGSPALRYTGICRGEARASQVTRPSSSCVLWSNTPPDTTPSLPQKELTQRAVVAFDEIQHSRHPERR